MGEPAPLRTTASMLAEIEGGTAAEAIMALRYRTSPPGMIHHDPLDRIIRKARTMGDNSTLQRGDLLQVIGPSGSGKTTFLLFLILTTILPPSWSFRPPSVYARENITVQLGGRGFHAALLYPFTHASPLPRLARGLRAHIENCLKDAVGVQVLVPVLQDEVERIVKDSLRRLRVMKLRPRWKDWALALRRLSFPHHPNVGSSNQRAEETSDGEARMDGLDLVVCDGLADGYWPERWLEEERGLLSAGSAGGGTARRRTVGIRGAEDVGMREIFESIGKVRKELGSIVVLSLQAFWHEKRDTPTGTSITTAFYNVHLPPPFPNPWSTREQNPYLAIPKDPTFWPLNLELTFTGKQARMQLPAETLLVDALRGLAMVKAAERSEGAEYVMYNGMIRVTDGQGRAGTREGEGWKFEISPDGFAASPPEVDT